MHAPRSAAHVFLLKLGDRIAHRRFDLALRLHLIASASCSPRRHPLLSGVLMGGISDGMSGWREPPEAGRKILLALPKLPLILAGADWRSDSKKRLQVGQNNQN
jgi:hypothetical protein